MAKVLVVDDDTALRELLYDVLTRKQHQVVTASSGSQALELLKTHRPEAMIVDLTIGKRMSGLELAKQVREFDDAVPIVLLARTVDSDVTGEDLQRLGISEVVRKELGVELFLGAVEQALQRAQSRHPAGRGKPVMGSLGTVLAVDDDPLVLKMLKLVLEARGVRLLTAASGEEALKRVAEKPDIILLDVNMAGMDGLMTLKKLRAAHPSLPVIMASGVGEEDVVRQALELGAYDYVTKPFNLEYLETVVLTKILLGVEG